MAQVSCRGTRGGGVYVVDEVIGSRPSSIMMENADFVVIYDLGAFGTGRRADNDAAFDCVCHCGDGRFCRGSLSKLRDSSRMYRVSGSESARTEWENHRMRRQRMRR
jgi:hypothetical protein